MAVETQRLAKIEEDMINAHKNKWALMLVIISASITILIATIGGTWKIVNDVADYRVDIAVHRKEQEERQAQQTATIVLHNGYFATYALAATAITDRITKLEVKMEYCLPTTRKPTK